MIVRLVAILCAVACVSACSARSRTADFLPSSSVSETTPLEGTLVVRVTVPRDRVAPHYVAPSTKGMTVHIAGLVEVKSTVGLTISARGCRSRLMTLQCELKVPKLHACPSRKNCYTATVVTYDAFSKGKIPRGAHALSTAQGIGFTIKRDKSTTLPIVLEGLPASVRFVPGARSVLQGTQAGGFILPKCSATPQRASVYGIDGDGNYILGIGAPKISLTSADTSQLAVSPASPSSPNAFTLTPPSPPAYPFGSRRIALTAKATAGSHGGGGAAHATISISYSGDICGHVDEFSVPTASSGPTYIAAGSDGALWFTESGASKIGRIPANASSGSATTEFSTPTSHAYPLGIARGPDGKLWFAEYSGNKIGRIPITAKSGADVTEIPASGTPAFIIAGPDGNLWFTEYNGNNVSRIPTSATPGSPQITEFGIPTASSAPEGIAVGPNGALWFTEYNANKIGTTPTGSPSVVEFAEPLGSPVQIVAGSDGALWFLAQTGNAVGRIDTSGNVTSTFALPAASSDVIDIAAGPDGALWFTEQLGNKVGRITVDGTITEFPIPTAASLPTGITVGPDGALWFVEQSGNKIGRLR